MKKGIINKINVQNEKKGNLLYDSVKKDANKHKAKVWL